MQRLRYWQAISQGLVQSMERDPDIFIAGIGVDDFKGVFGTTREAFERFGPSRVIDIPNCENAFAGIAIGAAAMGKRPVVVHPRDDFMVLALDQILNLAAKWKYMYAAKRGVPVVFRGIVGRGWGQGATHSQSLHAVFAHFPGLYVAAPASPADVKGLLCAALRGGSPTVLLENRALYEIEGDVPEDPISIPFGQARIIREGTDITIVGASLMAYEATRAADLLAAYGVCAEVIDPRSMRPLDESTILSSLRKTGRLVVADTSWAMYGFSSEIAALAAEKGHTWLKAPVRRVTPPDCPAPVSRPLEEAFHPTAMTILQVCLDVLGLKASKDTSLAEPRTRFVGPY